MKLARYCFGVLAVMVGIACYPTLAGEQDPPAPALTEVVRVLLDLTNAERAKEGKHALKLNAQLSKAAQEHSNNMVRQKKLSHQLDGQGPDKRIRQTGYKLSFWGENIAVAASAKEAMKMWMNSKGHRDNILKEQFSEIGIGITKDNKGKHYFTQVFAKPTR